MTVVAYGYVGTFFLHFHAILVVPDLYMWGMETYILATSVMVFLVFVYRFLQSLGAC